MTTISHLPVPTAAPRGVVQRTFVDVRILSGFTDEGHFSLLADDYLNTLSPQEKALVLANAQDTRAFVQSLSPLAQQNTLVRDIAHPHIDGIRADPLFVGAFGTATFRFAYVNPAHLIAIQPWIEPRSDAVPTDEELLLDFALPRKWDVPAEVSFIPPIGPIQIVSSNPALQGLTMELDQATGTVRIGAVKHLNLVQVMHFNGRFYLRNGYHRVSDALAVNRTEIPALVIEATAPNDIALPSPGSFNLGYLMTLPRPPLVSDFHSAAALTTKIRERRYGAMVHLDIKQFNIGI